MKLSEAVLLGSTNLSLQAWYWQSDTCGCLIGMGLNAVGHEPKWNQGENRLDAIAIFPWLADGFDIPLSIEGHPLTCHYECASIWGIYPKDQLAAWQIISVLAYEVQDGRLTLEQAVDWIRENEPQEPEVKMEKEEVLCELAKL